MEQHSQSAIPGLSLTEALDKVRNEVWKAVDSENGRPIAVKILEAAYEPILPRRFGQRHRALTNVLRNTHGWVPHLGTGVASDGRSYITMPYYRAGSLADQLKYGSTPWYPAASLVVRVATTLGGAHKHGWSFGRLRPSNVLLEHADQPHVTVYGSSRRRFDDGTAQFVAPEVTSGGEPLPASDVYSISLILASLIAGREVDQSEPVAAVLAEIAPDTPNRILEIIDYGLSPSVENRFANATKLAAVLAAALEDPDLSRPAGKQPKEVRQDAATSLDDNPLDLLLAEPLIQPQQTDLTNGSASPSGPPGADVIANHPGLPAALQDLTISRLPRSTRPPPVSVSAAEANDQDGPETEPPWFGDEDDVTESGPLFDLLDPVASKRPSVDAYQSDPTIEHNEDVQSRDEVTQLIQEFGLEEAALLDQEEEREPEESGAANDVDTDMGPENFDRQQLRPKAVDTPIQSPSVFEKQRSWSADVAQLILLQRQRIVSSITIVGLTLAIGLGAIAVTQLVRVNGVIVSEGGSGGDSSGSTTPDGDATAVDKRSPLNNLDHLDDVESVEFQITTAPIRRRVTSPATQPTLPAIDGTATTTPSVTTSANGSEPAQSTSSSSETTVSTAVDDSTSPPPTTEPPATTSPTTQPTTTTVEKTKPTERRRRPRP